MFLPVQSSAAGGWSLWDFRQETLSSPQATASGQQLYVTLGPVPQDELWLINRLVVSCDSSLDTTAGVYLDVIDPARAIDGTDTGNFDVADYASPLQLPGATAMVCAWEGAAAGAQGILRAQYQVMRKPSS